MKFLTLLVILASTAFPIERPRVLIITDMEGVGGVYDADEQLLPGQRRFEESRKYLIGEVNAAVQGALRGGAREVVVWDGHDDSRTLSISDLPVGAQLIQGTPTPADYYLEDRLYDGILFIGQHAMAGTKNGILAHSQSFSIQSISINGKPVGELGQVAAIAGYFNIPVIMLSGDQAACDEMLALQPRAADSRRQAPGGKAVCFKPVACTGMRADPNGSHQSGETCRGVYAVEDRRHC